jgi:hypothetical protein
MKLKHILRDLLIEDTLRQHLAKYPFLINALEDMGTRGRSALDTEFEFDQSGIIPDLYVKLDDNEPIIDVARAFIKKKLLSDIAKACYASPIRTFITAFPLVERMVEDALKENGKSTDQYDLRALGDAPRNGEMVSANELIRYFAFLYGKNMYVIPRQIVGKDRTPVLANAIVEQFKSGRANMDSIIYTHMVRGTQKTTFIKFAESLRTMVKELTVTLEQMKKDAPDADTVSVISKALWWLSNGPYTDDRDIATEAKEMRGFKTKMLNYEQNIPEPDGVGYYLKISSDPADKMRISISDFFSSCQNAYTGGYKHQLPSTVHDKNTKVAYILADTPFRDNKKNMHEQSPIMRVLIRFNPDTGKFAFDGIYPNGMEDAEDRMFLALIEKQLNKTQSRDYSIHYQDVPKHVNNIKSYSDNFAVLNKVKAVVRDALNAYPFISTYMKYMPREIGTKIINDIEETQPEGNAVAAWRLSAPHPTQHARMWDVSVIQLQGGADWVSDDAFNVRAEYALGLRKGWGNSEIWHDPSWTRWLPEAYLLHGNLDEINILNNSLFSSDEKQYIETVLNAFKFIRSDDALYARRIKFLIGYRSSNATIVADVLHYMNSGGAGVFIDTSHIDNVLLDLKFNISIAKSKGEVEVESVKRYERELKDITTFILPLVKLIKTNVWLLSREFRQKVAVAIVAEYIRKSHSSYSGIWDSVLPFTQMESAGITRLASNYHLLIPLEGEYIFLRE